MTPKEKAIDLFKSMDNQRQIGPDASKQCALIAVNEILYIISWFEFKEQNDEIKYWHEVKKELENI